MMNTSALSHDQSVHPESMESYDELSGNEDENIISKNSDYLIHGLELNESFQDSPGYYGNLITNTNELSRLSESDPDTYIKCKFNIISPTKGVCIPCQGHDLVKRIIIDGPSHLKHAFNKDVVLVKVIGVEYGRTPETQAEQRTLKGKIIGVFERKMCKDLEHPVFVCTQDFDQCHLMIPLCKTISKIDIGVPNRERSVELFEYNCNRRILTFRSNTSITQDKRQKFLFVVVVLNWEKSNRYPLGKVIDMDTYDKSDVWINAQLLAITIGLKRHGISPDRHFIKSVPPSDHDDKRENKCDVLTVFTIDSPSTQVLDDGFSVEELGYGRCKVGVHIADVASVVHKDDHNDVNAKEKLLTIYRGSGLPTDHMFSRELRDNFSLLENKPSQTISVFYSFDENGSQFENAYIAKTIVMSSKRLTYTEAQRILNNEDNNPSISIEIRSAVKKLGRLAKTIRESRLKRASFAMSVHRTSVSEDQFNNEDCEAHNLVEEFMILTNSEVANYILESFRSIVPLRRHLPPKNDLIQQWLDEHKNVANVICQLQDIDVPGITYLGIKNKEKQIQEKVPEKDFKIRITKQIWTKLVAAAQNDNFRKMQLLLCADELHPLQNKAVREWRELHNNAEYVCSADVENVDIDGRHFTLRIAPYVHFTSPIRRYIDLVAQRLVHAKIADGDAPYEEQEITEICQDMSEKSCQKKSYHKQMYCLEFVQGLQNHAKKAIASIEDISDSYFTLTLPEMNDEMHLNPIYFQYLNISNQPSVNFEKAVLTWKKRLFKYDGKGKLSRDANRYCQTVNPNINSCFVSYSDWEGILQALIKNDDAECRRKIKDINEQKEVIYDRTKHEITLPSNHGNMLVEDVTSEVTDRKKFVVNPHCHFEMEFVVSQALSIELIALEVNQPFVQLLNITDSVSFCLLHATHPVLSLAHMAKRKTKMFYRNEIEYQDIWKSILGMEFARNAVQNKKSATISDIPIKMLDSGKGIGSITLPVRYCEERGIDFGGLHTPSKTQSSDNYEDEGNDNEGKLLSPNYLCIRWPTREKHPNEDGDISEFTLVAHGETTTLIEDKVEHNYHVGFKLNANSIPFPEKKMGEVEMVCTMEILSKDIVDRRIEISLKILEDATPLARAIALGRQIENTDLLHENVVGDLLQRVNLMDGNNSKQHTAIMKALHSRFSLIQGPPGTGKTKTAVVLIKLFNMFNALYFERTGRKHAVVYCGPSNKSVDHSAIMYYHEMKKHSKCAPNFVRMYGQSHECTDFPVPGRTDLRQKAQNCCTDTFLQKNGFVLHHIIRQNDKPYAKKIKKYDSLFQNDYINVTFDEVKEYFDIISKATQEELKNYDVIFCTTSLTANPKLQNSVKVYQCIIDECGMCTEPETMVPIVFTRAEQIVLIGDHKQLQPIVLNKEAAKLGLRKSLFERYTKLQNTKLTMLIQQYRMHPSICSFPSEEFYNKTLLTSTAWKSYTPLKLWNDLQHLAFIDVRGEEATLTVASEEGNEKSKRNIEEAKQVKRLCKYLVKKEHIKETSVMVISQYNAQRHHLEMQLMSDFPDIKVNTVIASQGMECDYVIFSTVRSLPSKNIKSNPHKGWCLHNLGFITDVHQLNVAITRAKKGLFIIGNKELLQCDEVWNRLVKHFDNLGKVFKPSEFPPRSRDT